MSLMSWREAMSTALYGARGYVSAGPGSTGFRTRAYAGPAFAGTLLRLVDEVDAALGRPAFLDLVDVGAGHGEVLAWFATQAPPGLRERLRLTGVEQAPRPAHLPPAVDWTRTLPAPVTGVVLATEWLDNVPLESAQRCEEELRRVLVDPRTGHEELGGPLDPSELGWARQWWPPSLGRIELGGPRDDAWAAAVATVHRGLALTVDYGHTRGDRPALGTLTGVAGGRLLPPVPDGSLDVTAHVAIDSVRAAGEAVVRAPATLTTQRAALRALGLRGDRPPGTLSTEDPARYVAALAEASRAGVLMDQAGLGGQYWLLQPVGLSLPVLSRMAA